VLPKVPVRQWVLSLPFEIRYRLAWDGELVSAVLAVFLRVVYGWYRRQARQQGHAEPRCGSVTFVRRVPQGQAPGVLVGATGLRRSDRRHCTSPTG